MKEFLNQARAKILVDIKDDGVYLKVALPPNVEKPTVEEIMDTVDAYGIIGVDMAAIEFVAKDPQKAGIQKISDNLKIKGVDEIAYVNFEDNNMIATINFSPPVNNGKKFTPDEIKYLLAESGVVHGIDPEVFEEIADARMYFFDYVIARGTEKIDGEDGYLKFFFNTKKKSLKPKQLEDGKVDYHNLELIEKAYTGKTLMSIIPPTDGFDGKDVRGNIIPAKPGKPAEKLPVGKNVSLSEDELSLIADIDGQVEYVNKKVNILPVLEITTDVGNATGNIDFNGSVIIRGMVQSNFTVKAKGNVEIYGIVESAKIEADTDLYLYSGMMGAEKGTIVAGGNLTAKFLDSVKATVGGNITTNSIMHSNIVCNGSVSLTGKNGLLVGGRVCVGDMINATVIGSSMATRTEIIVGNTPAMLEAYETLVTNLNSLKLKLDKTEKIINVLKSVEEPLPPDKKAILLKSFHTKIYITMEKTKIENEIKEMLPRLDNRSGKIGASKVIYAGVLVAIGSARMKVENDLPSPLLVNRNGSIKVKSYF